MRVSRLSGDGEAGYSTGRCRFIHDLFRATGPPLLLRLAVRSAVYGLWGAKSYSAGGWPATLART